MGWWLRFATTATVTLVLAAAVFQWLYRPRPQVGVAPVLRIVNNG